MKNLIIGFAVSSILAAACNTGADKAIEKKDTLQNNTEQKITQFSKDPIKEIIGHYLEVKNALASDNAKEAATHSKALLHAIENIDTATLTTLQKKVFGDAGIDAKEHAEHIGANANKIAHQREHFIMLSDDMYDLLKVFKTDQALYLDHCPMANDGKGANWLSEIKEIKNPYEGSKMPGCGTVKEEIK